MAKKSSKQKHYHPTTGVIILLALGAILAWYVKQPEKGPGLDDNALVIHQGGTTQPSTAPSTTKNALSVSGQKAGSSIVIDEVSLQQPGYVVIHSVAAGQPAGIVAHSGLLSAGTKQDLVIRYPTKAGVSYYA